MNKKPDQKTNSELLIYGKVPPQAIALESAVLGALLLEKDAFDTANRILKPESFYLDKHQLIYKAIHTLSNSAKAVDIFTITEQLEKSGELEAVGGQAYIASLTNMVVTGANVESHSRIIHEKYLKRKQIDICSKGLTNAYDNTTDAFDNLDELQKHINQISISDFKSKVEHISSPLIERFKRLEELRHREDHLTGVPSGFKELDLFTAGWQAPDLIIIAARPSVGKTAFALNLARNAASHKSKRTPVVFFSLEMSKGQITDRMISAESGISLEFITRARVNDDLMQKIYINGIQKLASVPIFIDDTPALNIYELKTKARRLKKDEAIGLIVLDYLQLMSGLEDRSVKNREQEISNISRNLKGLAKELHIPIIALSQLSREVEKQKREPQLSDLRESGAIEQDADVVMFLTRPDYQNTDSSDPSLRDMGDVHIKKHRNGDLAKIPMRTMLNIQRWMTSEEYSLFHFNQQSGQQLLPMSEVIQGDNPF